MKYTIEFFRDPLTKKEPAKDWLYQLDFAVKSRISARFRRIREGNLGDFKALGGGLFEFRFHFGGGYRVYFAKDGGSLILLLMGGNKSSQLRDINTAHTYWQRHLEEKKYDKKT